MRVFTNVDITIQIINIYMKLSEIYKISKK